ncbi:DNA polymerase III subunit delta [Saccharomonospora iraqiensis]|uniref:DNA polymerase III subunit delta n=2 Tax=Saccharomonospora iraqiensis TaxID=52698 RepID=UPI00022E18DF|nr:hypothetical protein [Saccharomonospora iraqiensis]
MTAPSTTPAPLHLVLGEEELLVERAVRAVLDSVRLADPAAELTRARVSEVTPAELAEMVSPSLFSEGRVIVLDAAQEIANELADAVLSHAADPADGIVLVVVHSGGGRSKAAKSLPAGLREAGATVTECRKITRAADREAFVRGEVRAAGGRIEAAAVTALIESVGSDLRELASAASQLVADSGGSVDERAVRRYHRGRADVSGFEVAEKAVAGDRAAALESLRWAQQIGVAHVLLADALAAEVRRVAVAAGGRPARELQSELRVPEWKVDKIRKQARGWSSAGIAEAMRVVARVNAEVKGAAADADYAVERAVLDVVAARGRR